MYRNRFSIHHPKEYMLFRDIDKNQKNTNKVRHRFASLSVEEANSATFLFHQFVSIYNLPNLAQSNARMSQEVEELESKKRELELLSAKLKSLQLDYENKNQGLSFSQLCVLPRPKAARDWIFPLSFFTLITAPIFWMCLTMTRRTR